MKTMIDKQDVEMTMTYKHAQMSVYWVSDGENLFYLMFLNWDPQLVEVGYESHILL